MLSITVFDGFAQIPEKKIRDQYTDEELFSFHRLAPSRKNVPRLLETFEQCKKQRDVDELLLPVRFLGKRD